MTFLNTYKLKVVTVDCSARGCFNPVANTVTTASYSSEEVLNWLIHPSRVQVLLIIVKYNTLLLGCTENNVI